VLVLVAGLGVADACAVVRIFFTSSAQPYGLTDPSLAFQPTEGSQTDPAFYQVSAFPPLDAWEQTPAIDWQAGDFAYVWLRFHQETNNRKINGVRLELDDVPADIAYYVMDDLAGDNGTKRWDAPNTMPDAPEYRMDLQILRAESSNGIRNRSTSVDNWNLYDNVSRTALLGAVRYADDGLRGIGAMTWPQIPIPPGPLIVWETAQANWIPEPATLGTALLLCAITGRRRAGALGSEQRSRS
jgi:hypothetical protein